MGDIPDFSHLNSQEDTSKRERDVGDTTQPKKTANVLGNMLLKQRSEADRQKRGEEEMRKEEQKTEGEARTMRDREERETKSAPESSQRNIDAMKEIERKRLGGVRNIPSEGHSRGGDAFKTERRPDQPIKQLEKELGTRLKLMAKSKKNAEINEDWNRAIAIDQNRGSYYRDDQPYLRRDDPAPRGNGETTTRRLIVSDQL